MYEIEANGYKSYIVALFWLCGVVDKTNINLPTSQRNINIILNDLKKNKQINQETNNDFKAKLYKMTNFGYQTLPQTKELVDFWDRLTRGKRIAQTESSRNRYKSLSKFTTQILIKGYSLDFIKLNFTQYKVKANAYKVNDTKAAARKIGHGKVYEDGTEMIKQNDELEDILYRTNINESYFFSTKICKSNNRKNNRGKSRLDASILMSLFLSKGNIYGVYYLSENLKTWSLSIEHRMKEFISISIQKAYVEKNIKMQNLKGIFIVDDLDYGMEYLLEKPNTNKTRKKIYPPKLYESCHVITLDEIGFKILKIIEKENWERNLDYILFGSDNQKKIIRSKTKEKEGVFQILTNDIVKIAKMIETKNKVKTVYCYSWQKKYIKSKLNKRTKIIVVKDDFIDKIVKQLEIIEAKTKKE